MIFKGVANAKSFTILMDFLTKEDDIRLFFLFLLVFILSFSRRENNSEKKTIVLFVFCFFRHLFSLTTCFLIFFLYTINLKKTKKETVNNMKTSPGRCEPRTFHSFSFFSSMQQLCYLFSFKKIPPPSLNVAITENDQQLVFIIFLSFSLPSQFKQLSPSIGFENIKYISYDKSRIFVAPQKRQYNNGDNENILC